MKRAALPRSAATLCLLLAGLGSANRVRAEEPTPPLRWAGTTFDWNNRIATRFLGIGGDYIGVADGTYRMTFGLSPGYLVFWRPRHQLRVWANVTFGYDIAEKSSNGTEQRRVVSFDDLPVGLSYAATLYTSGQEPSIGGQAALRDPTLLGAGAFRTWLLLSGFTAFPTSLTSQAEGVVLTTSLSAGIRQQLRLLGGDSPALPCLLLTASERWNHSFATGGASYNPRMQADTTSGTLEPNTLQHTLEMVLPLYDALQLHGALALRQGFLPSYGPVTVAGQPVGASAVTTIDTTVFEAGLDYLIVPELAVDAGYRNEAPELGRDGKRQSLFYSPSALFFITATLSFDRLYQRLKPPAIPATTPVSSKN